MNAPENARTIAIRWFREVWQQRRTEAIYELLAPDAVGHLEGNQDIVGPAPFAVFHQSLLAAIPDLQLEILDTLAEPGKVCVRWHFTGTHTGAALGLQPTGSAVAYRGITWFRVADGKIVEGWDAWNQEALLATLAGRALTKLNG